MTQQIPQREAGDVLVLEICTVPESAQVGSAVSAQPLQLCILVHYVNQAQLASYCFHLSGERERRCVETYS